MGESAPSKDNPSSHASSAPGTSVKIEKPRTPANDDPFLDKAVDDIVHGESDQLLKAKDEELAHAFEPQKTRWQRLRQWIGDVWAIPKYRYTAIGSVIALLMVLFIFPITRWGIMNAVGFRASASLQVTDDKTTQPIKNATVTIRGKSAKTDENGTVKLEKLKLGPAQLTISKTAYTQVSQQIKLGLGSNDLAGRKLVAVGARLRFKVIDWLSKKPVSKAEATIGESSAFSNQDGIIELPIEPTDAALAIKIGAEHYLVNSVDTSLSDTNTKDVSLVADYTNYFVSNRNGKFELYTVQADGKEEKLILAATGRENPSEMQLATNPEHTAAAFVSKRDNEKNKDGYQLDSLNVFDMTSNLAKKISSSERIYIIGWDKTRLLYVKVAAGASGSNPQRERLVSYDTATSQERELASSNFFVSTILIKDYVYFTPSDLSAGARKGVLRAKTDGTDRQTLFNENTWSVFRTDWDVLTIQAPNSWRKYTVNRSIEKLDAAPANVRSINFVDNADSSKTAWFEERDGKGTLLIRNTGSKEDTVLRQQSGIASIVGWAGNKYIVYRVVSQTETADYIINIEGGEPAKIKDVYNVASLGQRY